MLSPLRVAPSPSRRSRHLLLSASVAALFIAGIPFAAQAGDVTIGSFSSYSVPVYGNSQFAHPESLDTSRSSNNKLTILGASISDSAYGAYAGAGQESSQNTLKITDGGSVENAYGGYSGNAAATQNTVTVTGSTVGLSIYGGASNGDGNATNNSVTVTDSSVGHGGGASGGTAILDLFGGSSFRGDATENSVTISGSSSIGSTVYGGSSYSGAAMDNSVTISEGTFSSSVAGGYSSTGTATGNSVEITGGTFLDEIYGGQSSSGTATDNSVTISRGRFDKAIYGGKSSGAATGNSITISDGIFSGTVYGGGSDNGAATGNSLTINGGSFSEAVYGGDGHTSASNNTITISRGRFDKAIYGGHSTSGATSNNTITISDGIFSRTVYGGSSNDGDASNNSITISGGSIGATIYAGAGSSATNNTVNILGGTLGTGGGTAPSLFGGVHSSGIGDVFTGNALNLHVSGQTANTVKNFEYLNFYLPTTVADGDIVLTAAGMADLTNGSGKSSVVNVGIDGGSSTLAVGDTVTLISAGTLVTNDDLNTTADGTGMQGVTLQYAFDIAADDHDLTATVTSSGTTESSKALSEGGTVQASVVNQGSDLSSGSGMTNAIGAARSNMASFSAMSGGSVRTETGSHVDVKGVSLLAGLSGTFELLDTMVVAAPYLEYGYGAYDTYNTFASGSVHGTGDSFYVGAGVLAHMDLLETETGHAYVEGGARAGMAYNSFKSDDLVSGGVAAQYDASSAYYGLNAGLGYVWNLTTESSLDLYGQYSWNELGSDSVTLSTGETVNFDAIDSHRVRLGARYSYEISEQATPYVDVAWEHEFDGSVSATTNGLAIAEPSLSGDTGILSSGLKLTPSEDLPLTLDLNVTGYVGRNQGVSGGLQAKVDF